MQRYSQVCIDEWIVSTCRRALLSRNMSMTVTCKDLDSAPHIERCDLTIITNLAPDLADNVHVTNISRWGIGYATARKISFNVPPLAAVALHSPGPLSKHVSSEVFQLSTTSRNNTGSLNLSNSSPLFNATGKLLSVKLANREVTCRGAHACVSRLDCQEIGMWAGLAHSLTHTHTHTTLPNETGKFRLVESSSRDGTCRCAHEYVLIIELSGSYNSSNSGPHPNVKKKILPTESADHDESTRKCVSMSELSENLNLSNSNALFNLIGKLLSVKSATSDMACRGAHERVWMIQ